MRPGFSQSGAGIHFLNCQPGLIAQVESMKRVLLTLGSLFLCCLALGSSEQRIRNQFVEYATKTAASESLSNRHLDDMREDGTWADIDYASQRRGDWPTRVHLDRLIALAAVYADEKSVLFEDKLLGERILSGVDHWIRNDYQNPNWYNERIGVPYRLGSVLLLMGNAAPEEMLERARPLMYRSELGMTGQNKVWCAGIGIMKAVLYGDRELMSQAVADVWSELAVSSGEGIQADWSFHQHGPQQQFGNYGRSFGADMVQWASALRGTEYALAGESLEVLRNYLLEGPAWILWNGRMDFSGCGRQVNEGSQRKKARSIGSQLAQMKAIDPEFEAAYSLALESLTQSQEGNRLLGFKSFWRSEMGVQRRPDWYASVKMSSTRVIGSESTNNENMLGLHLGDGVLLNYLEGDEYEDLVPLWDWKRLPGTTCDQGIDDLAPALEDGYGGSGFSGVISSGEHGIASMIYQRDTLTARKSWFFFDNQIVCLGAGISGKTRGDVFTSVEQSRLKGDLVRENQWVWHNTMGYQFMQGSPEVLTGTVRGNWNDAFPTHGDRPVSGDVFSLWINHGESPVGQDYAYCVFPSVSVEEMREMKSMDGSHLLRNDRAVQAVARGDAVYAVFYDAGVLSSGGELEVEVDGPCLLIVETETLFVSDPTHSLQSLEIKVDGKSYFVELPQGAQRGNQAQLKR